MILLKTMTYSATFPREHRGCRGSQEGQWGVGSTVGRKQVGEDIGSQWLDDRGAAGEKRSFAQKTLFCTQLEGEKSQGTEGCEKTGINSYAACYPVPAVRTTPDDTRLTRCSLKSHHHLMDSLH